MKIDKGGNCTHSTSVVCGSADIKVLDAKGRYHVQLPEVRSGHGGLTIQTKEYSDNKGF